MEPETVYQPDPPAVHIESDSSREMPPDAKQSGRPPKKPPKLLYIFGGLAVILISVAFGIMFFGKNNATTISDAISGGSTSTVDSSGWPKYNNSEFFYELAIPPK